MTLMHSLCSDFYIATFHRMSHNLNNFPFAVAGASYQDAITLAYKLSLSLTGSLPPHLSLQVLCSSLIL